MSFIDYTQSNINVKMGKTAISKTKGGLVCYGLGSCVGVYIHDFKLKIGGAAHVWLPYAKNTCILTELIHKLMDMGCSNSTMQVTLVGGAKVVKELQQEIGSMNVSFVKNVLAQFNMSITSYSLGGHLSRTAKMDVTTGLVAIKTRAGLEVLN